MSETTVHPEPSDLYGACIDVKSVNIDWSEAMNDDDEPRWTAVEAFTYHHGDVRYTLVSRDNQVAAVYLPDGTRIDRDEYDTYRDDNEDEDGELPDGALTEEDFDELCEVEPTTHGAEGPMMSYYYALDTSPSSRNDAVFGPYSDRYDSIEAAYRLRDVPLCLVLLDDEYVLALTGGGMDLTWEIVTAFTRLHQLPPAAFCRPPGFDHEDQDYLVACMKASLGTLVSRAQRDLDDLTSKYPSTVA